MSGRAHPILLQTTLVGNTVYSHLHGLSITGKESQILQNTVSGNTQYGIYFSVGSDTGSTISENVVYSNGIDGIYAYAPSASPWLVMENNEAYNNADDGIEADGNVELRGNTASHNTNAGMVVRGGALAEDNVAITRAVLSGVAGPQRDVVILNAAAALLAGGTVTDIEAGLALAAESVDSGAAMARLEALVELSQGLGRDT